MTGDGSPSRWLLVGAALMLLAVGVAGCLGFGSEGSEATQPSRADCASRGGGSPTEITQNHLDQDTTWKPDPDKRADYKVTGQLELNGHTLEIEPCTIVEMGKNAELEATRQGSVLKLDGEATEQIHVRGAQQTQGYWDRISLHMSETDGHVLEHAVIQHGNGTAFKEKAALEVHHLETSSTLTIENVTVQNTDGRALHLTAGKSYDQGQGAPNFAFGNNTFTDNTGPGVSTDLGLAEHLDARSEYEGNDGPDVRVRTGTLEGEHSWADLGVPYQIANPKDNALAEPINVDGRLNLDPGVVVAFEEGGKRTGINVRGSDTSVAKPGLFAHGTSEQEIRITSAHKGIGDWNSIHVQGEGTTTVLENTTVEYAGAGQHGKGDHHKGASLALNPTGNGPTFDGYEVRLDNVTLTAGRVDGIQIGPQPGIDLTMTNVRIGLHQLHPIAVRPANVEEISSDTVFYANSNPGVKILDSKLPQRDVRLPPLETHYLLADEASGGLKVVDGTLTLPAGTHIKVPDDRIIRVDRADASSGYGTIEARGTASDPVVLEGATPQPGSWRGLLITTGSKDNVLEHTQIRHGGSDRWTCGGDGTKDPSIEQGGNLVVCQPDLSREQKQNGAQEGKIEWRSGSSTQHPSTHAGIWVEHCGLIDLKTEGSPQVHYDNFDTGGGGPCPPRTN